MPQAFALILAGGSGTRFWPASRTTRPKQVLAIGPGAKDPLIARTARRIEALCPPDRAYIATGTPLVNVTRQALPWFPESAFLAEPVARNTAACIGWATALIHRRDPEALIAALPSDQLMDDEPGFRAAVAQAFKVAESGTIVTMGIKPNRPETGYGYIEVGSELSPGVRKVARFVEKPTREVAEGYVASGNYLWNAGMFFFRAQSMLDAIREHMPKLAEGIERIERAAKGGAAAERAETEAVFATLESISIDYGIMEKVRELAVIPADVGWSDLGSWHTVWELGEKDAQGNVAPESAVLVDAQNNLIENLRKVPGGKRIVALVGVHDLCVVDTDDALLIIPRERCQDVRAIVEELKRRGDPV
jgi:mannose-1-phosphate guanylyltransferase